MDLSATNTNAYKITVRSSAGGEDGAPDLADYYDGDDLYELEVTVNVRKHRRAGQSHSFSIAAPDRHPVECNPCRRRCNRWAMDSGGGPATIPQMALSPTTLHNGSMRTWTPMRTPTGRSMQTWASTCRWRCDTRTEWTTQSGPCARYPHTRCRKDIITSNANPVYPDQRVLVGGTTINRDLTRRYIPEKLACRDPGRRSGHGLRRREKH